MYDKNEVMGIISVCGKKLTEEIQTKSLEYTFHWTPEHMSNKKRSIQVTHNKTKKKQEVIHVIACESLYYNIKFIRNTRVGVKR